MSNNLIQGMETTDSFNYMLSAVRGIQAGREYYVTMCPLRLIPKLFLFDENELPPELRAQRVINRSRIPEIASYIVSNPKDYVFSSIAASIDGKVKFIPSGNSGLENKIGTLVIPMTARFIINDGQHRRAAIEEALKIAPNIGQETISVVFFIDAGLKKSQQMFSDLNKHAVRPTRSLGILYDNRDSMSQLSLKIIGTVPVFKGFTDLEKTTISNRSKDVFTLSSVHLATMALLGKKQKRNKISQDEENLAIEYWTELSKIIPEWELLINQKISGYDLRRDYIHAHGITLHALGIIGNAIIAQKPTKWKKELQKLKNIDWSKSNYEQWEGRAMIGGRINKTQMNLTLTTNALKQIIGLPLAPDEEKAERNFRKGIHKEAL